MSVGSELDSVAGGLYAKVVDAEFARQRDREATVRQRGAMIVSTSGGLVTLILALAGVTRGRPTTLVTTQASKVLLGAGLGLFVLAGTLGIFVSFPWRGVKSAHPKYSEWVVTLTDRDWTRTDLAEVAREVAEHKITAIKKLRGKNDQRNWVLAGAIIAMVLATACLAASVVSSL